MKKEKTEKKVFNTEKSRNIIFNIMVVICILLFAISIAPITLQNDTFYTIKVGEYIMQNGIFNLTEDTFSWHELPYTYPHWLYDLAIYSIYSISGQFRNLYFNNDFYSFARIKYLFVK